MFDEEMMNLFITHKVDLKKEVYLEVVAGYKKYFKDENKKEEEKL